MGARNASDWLQIWETSSALPAAERPLELLRAATSAEFIDELADLPLGRRDALLLDLREALFGPELRCSAVCPACAAQLELDLPIAGVRSQAPGLGLASVSCELDGIALRLRLPTTRDQLAITGCGSVAEARMVLLRGCVELAVRRGTVLAVEALPAAVVDQLVARMQAADPQAAVAIGLRCPSCALEWDADFDIAQCLWAELDHWARHLLLDVHELAAAYGWGEAAILGLTAARRRRYLEMLAA
jgi:hypothetical protein